ncbi:MAG: rhomboid family intramembrane serine protease [Acidobacteria bacterium]|nr:rhomboid family intramembrane serine protease [Acidobacteriota bacterium]
MSPPSSPYATYSFGPGRLTPAVKALILANVAGYLATLMAPSLTLSLGLIPAMVVERLWFWQPVTYMFQHGGLFHLLFNMLALWMFGVELERLWGTRFFTTYYAVAGIGAALTTILASLLPFGFAEALYVSVTVGASGAIYGLLLAYALTYPNRPIYLYMVFPIPAKVFVLIIGVISFLSSISGSQSGVAHATHLGGIAAGYFYLVWRRGTVGSQVRSQLLRWRLNRLRKRFEVHDGGRRSDRGPGPDRWVH